MTVFPIGATIVNINPGNPAAVIVEALESVDGEGFRLFALYLGKRFARHNIVSDLDGYREATSGDHALAKVYAQRFNHQDAKE